MIVTHHADGSHEDWWDATVAEVVPPGTGGVPVEVGPLLRLHDTRTTSAFVPADRVVRVHHDPCQPFPALCHASDGPVGGGA